MRYINKVDWIGKKWFRMDARRKTKTYLAVMSDEFKRLKKIKKISHTSWLNSVQLWRRLHSHFSPTHTHLTVGLGVHFSKVWKDKKSPPKLLCRSGFMSKTSCLNSCFLLTIGSGASCLFWERSQVLHTSGWNQTRHREQMTKEESKTLYSSESINRVLRSTAVLPCSIW